MGEYKGSQARGMVCSFFIHSLSLRFIHTTRRRSLNLHTYNIPTLAESQVNMVRITFAVALACTYLLPLPRRYILTYFISRRLRSRSHSQRIWRKGCWQRKGPAVHDWRLRCRRRLQKCMLRADWCRWNRYLLCCRRPAPEWQAWMRFRGPQRRCKYSFDDGVLG